MSYFARARACRRAMPDVGRILRPAAMACLVLACGGDALDPDRPAVANVEVTPNRLSVGAGASSPLTVEVRDAGGTVLTGRKVVWASSDRAIATVSSGGVVTGVAPGSAQVAASVEGKSGVVDVTVLPKAVASIRLSPDGDVQLLVGQSATITATTLDANGEVLPDRAVSWTSNATSVATVSSSGVISAIAPGGAVITATSEGKSAVVAVTVSSVPVATIAVDPSADEVVVSQTLQLTATARDAQGSPLAGRTIGWATSDASTATVSSTGLVTGINPGSVTITASAEGKTGTATITVREKPVGAVIISPAQLSVEAGKTRQLTVQVTDAQGNVLTGRPVTFSSGDVKIATVSSAGLVTGVALGTTTITATSEGKSGTADVTVVAVPVASVTLSPPSADLIVGQTAAFTVVARDAAGNVLSGRSVGWTSGAPSVATVSSSGTVTALGPGTAVIFATVEGQSASATVTVRQIAVTSVTVDPASSSVAVGASVQLAATVKAGSTVLTDRVVGWSSSDDAVAVVSSTGRVTGLKAGTVTITATSDGVSGTAFVAVGISSIVVSPSSATIAIGGARQFTAVARDASNAPIAGVSFEWSSSAPQTATVDANGLVTGVAAGPATISAAVGPLSGTSAVTVSAPPVAKVTVTPASPSVNAGDTVQLTATLTDAAGNELTGRSVSWSSSNVFRATVDDQGLVKTSLLAKGTKVTITATSEGKSGSAVVTIK